MFTLRFTLSAFRILPTIPHPFPQFSIPHFTFRIPQFRISNKLQFTKQLFGTTKHIYRIKQLINRKVTLHELRTFEKVTTCSSRPKSGMQQSTI